MAMACYRTSVDKKANVGIKFIESLLKIKFSMFLTDSEGQTPFAYLLIASMPKQHILPVVELFIKHGFDLFKNAA